MKKLNNDNLTTIYGGDNSISATVINALVNVIKLVKDAGYSLGSGIRRISENNICPLE